MDKKKALSEKEISVINELMERKSEIVLEPRKDGYFIYESKKKLIMRPEKQSTTESKKKLIMRPEKQSTTE